MQVYPKIQKTQTWIHFLVQKPVRSLWIVQKERISILVPRSNMNIVIYCICEPKCKLYFSRSCIPLIESYLKPKYLFFTAGMRLMNTGAGSHLSISLFRSPGKFLVAAYGFITSQLELLNWGPLSAQWKIKCFLWLWAFLPALCEPGSHFFFFFFLKTKILANGVRMGFSQAGGSRVSSIDNKDGAKWITRHTPRTPNSCLLLADCKERALNTIPRFFCPKLQCRFFFFFSY